MKDDIIAQGSVFDQVNNIGEPCFYKTGDYSTAKVGDTLANRLTTIGQSRPTHSLLAADGNTTESLVNIFNNEVGNGEGYMHSLSDAS